MGTNALGVAEAAGDEAEHIGLSFGQAGGVGRRLGGSLREILDQSTGHAGPKRDRLRDGNARAGLTKRELLNNP